MLFGGGMNTTRLVVLVATLAPVAARAQEDPGECTTTTTVHCTGAAAKYAVPGAVAPQAAPQPPPPVIAPPPVYYPPQPMMVNLKLGDGWQLVQHSDGSWWRERSVSTASTGMVTTGAILFGATWLATGIASMTSDHSSGAMGWWPVIGAWINAAASDSCYNCSNGLATTLYVLDGLAQAGGFVTLLVGLAAGPKKIERQPIRFVPTFGGAAAVGQF
jgi:hypothetical protein